MNHSADNSAAAFIERSGFMRVAISVAAIALASSPAFASPSCMTQSEARQKFPTAHLWWHGPNRCWDATPPSRQRLAERNRARETRQAQRAAPADQDVSEETKPSHRAVEPRWRDAMSRASAADLAGVSAPARAEAGIDAAPPSASGVDWRERWVEIAQRIPPVAAEATVAKATSADLAADASGVAPIVTPLRVMLMLLVLLLAIGAYELLRRPVRRT